MCVFTPNVNTYEFYPKAITHVIIRQRENQEICFRKVNIHESRAQQSKASTHERLTRENYSCIPPQKVNTHEFWPKPTHESIRNYRTKGKIPDFFCPKVSISEFHAQGSQV